MASEYPQRLALTLVARNFLMSLNSIPQEGLFGGLTFGAASVTISKGWLEITKLQNAFVEASTATGAVVRCGWIHID